MGRTGPVRHSTAFMIRNSLPTPLAADSTRGPDYRDRTNGTNLRTMLATPRKTDGERGGRGDVLSQLRGYPSKHAGMPLERMDAWSPAYDRRKSPTMDAVMSGAMMSLTPTANGNLTAPSMLKWAGARALASLLQSHGLTGTAALPITYGWMMGYPPGWLGRALRSAVRAGLLRHPSSLKRSETQ
jgi:hypothetical protein